LLKPGRDHAVAKAGDAARAFRRIDRPDWIGAIVGGIDRDAIDARRLVVRDAEFDGVSRRSDGNVDVALTGRQYDSGGKQ
jgi:hypothetical protein